MLTVWLNIDQILPISLKDDNCHFTVLRYERYVQSNPSNQILISKFLTILGVVSAKSLKDKWLPTDDSAMNNSLKAVFDTTEKFI